MKEIPLAWAMLVAMWPSSKDIPSKCFRSKVWSCLPSFFGGKSSPRESKMWSILRRLALVPEFSISYSRIALHKLSRLLNDSKPPMVITNEKTIDQKFQLKNQIPYPWNIGMMAKSQSNRLFLVLNLSLYWSGSLAIWVQKVVSNNLILRFPQILCCAQSW